jgi:tetratricopeptide (TPR) repeat protein
MKQAAILASSRLQARLLQSVCLLLWLACLSLAQPLAAIAQGNEPTPLPPAAQEAVNKGILAAKIPDYLLAIRYFEEARKLAPDAPVIYLNMGLAESKIPGRELRAMAWFGAYLAAYPEAPNAAAVKEQIAVLEVRSQSNILRLIKTVQDAASQFSGETKENNLGEVVELWAKAGDFTSAFKTADLVQDDHNYGPYKSIAQWYIAKAQVEIGDIAGAQKAVDLIQDAYWKSTGQLAIAEAQIKAANSAGAQKTLASALKTVDLIQDADNKSSAQRYIAAAQAKAGDIAGAQKTVDLIGGISFKNIAQKAIAAVQAKAGITNAPNSTRQLTSDTQPPIQPVITVSDWLYKLDDLLNTETFLDLAGYLKSMPDLELAARASAAASLGASAAETLYGKSLPTDTPHNNPKKAFFLLSQTAMKIVSAQNVITGMLKQEASK